MGVASNEFVGNPTYYRVNIPLGFSDSGMEHNLKKQVPKFLLHGSLITRFNGFHTFVSLFNQVLDQSFMGLFCIPRTPTGRPQSVHDRYQIGESTPLQCDYSCPSSTLRGSETLLVTGPIVRFSGSHVPKRGATSVSSSTLNSEAATNTAPP